MNYILIPMINESELREAIFIQYDVEININDVFGLIDDYTEIYLDPTSYAMCDDDPEYVEFFLVLGYLNDIFPQYDSVIIRYD